MIFNMTMIVIVLSLLLITPKSQAKTMEDLYRAKTLGNEIKKSLNDASKIIDNENYAKKELIKQRDLIIAKLSAKTKEFRRLHDIVHPELKHYPIIIVKKGKVDAERSVISAALGKGAEDLLYKLHSPCERLLKTRESQKAELRRMKDKFATEQETMDMMPLDQRINYDEHMIRHWTDVVRELEADISAIYDST
ncbi:hypothetical protein BMR1_03g02110 [Babesia microti strain RI]|uniref:Uncharacterized protein n=1 Tax=Babesia microti (strain RI) TaxID=1133968 RepID=A0A1R4ABN3_BABMR|nr:hypothetical protein BMR1_03g02110 [Babesia microti strain RI]SJK86423.1 hypothetical protein BMR1_03g02110 [Babesia microti strain RI]|eukprot:XP_021338582.1 hypothetical protein BMR1_03g02110 [Babesia microti strain RI]